MFDQLDQFFAQAQSFVNQFTPIAQQAVSSAQGIYGSFKALMNNMSNYPPAFNYPNNGNTLEIPQAYSGEPGSYYGGNNPDNTAPAGYPPSPPSGTNYNAGDYGAPSGSVLTGGGSPTPVTPNYPPGVAPVIFDKNYYSGALAGTSGTIALAAIVLVLVLIARG